MRPTSEEHAVDDDELIGHALHGDTLAFGRLVHKYQDRLYTTMSHVTGSTDEARDVVQDAFMHAFVKLETFRRSSAFYTWLYRIAFNTAISRRRRTKPTVSLDQIRDATGEQPLDGAESPSEPMEREERIGQVRAALSALQEEHRTILILREMEDRSYEEIAEILDLPVGTVRSRLFRARMQLRDHLKTVMQQD